MSALFFEGLGLVSGVSIGSFRGSAACLEVRLDNRRCRGSLFVFIQEGKRSALHVKSYLIRWENDFFPFKNREVSRHAILIEIQCFKFR